MFVPSIDAGENVVICDTGFWLVVDPVDVFKGEDEGMVETGLCVELEFGMEFKNVDCEDKVEVDSVFGIGWRFQRT